MWSIFFQILPYLSSSRIRTFFLTYHPQQDVVILLLRTEILNLSKMDLERVLVYLCGILAISWAGGVQALYDPSGPVTDLTPTTFDSKIKQGVWMVEFYAPWYDACSVCVIM